MAAKMEIMACHIMNIVKVYVSDDAAKVMFYMLVNQHFLRNLCVLNKLKLKKYSFYVKKPPKQNGCHSILRKNIKHILSILPRHVIPQNEGI